MATRLLYSDSLVRARHASTADAMRGWENTGLAPVYQSFVDTTSGENQGVESYLRQLRRELGALGLHPNTTGLLYHEVRNASMGEAIARMRSAQDSPGADIIMTPNPQVQGLKEVLSEAPDRDGDAMTRTGRVQRWSATPRSMRRLAEHELGDLSKIDPDRIAVVGANGDVNSGLLAWLHDDGIEPGILIDRSNSAEQIPYLHRNADLVFSATGVAGLLSAGDLLRRPTDGHNPAPMVVIDAGVSLNRRTQMTHGDVDPVLYTYSGKTTELVITPSPVIYPDGTVLHKGHGVGRLTVAEFIAAGVMDVAGPRQLDAQPVGA